MTQQTLGARIKELRLAQNVSLRQFANTVGIAPAFLSDIELERRFPSNDVLQKIADHLKVPFGELKPFDVRDSVTEIRKLVQGNAAWGMAFRTAAEHLKQSGLTPGEFVERVTGDKREDSE